MTDHYKISKILSMNDTGETSSHQAGILIPKEEKILGFFPELNPEEKNPRVSIEFQDDSSRSWKFNFIYYNNKFFGGTRNEFRLTGMTRFINSNNLKAGDEVFLERDSENHYYIRYKKSKIISAEKQESGTKIRLSSKWRVISF